MFLDKVRNPKDKHFNQSKVVQVFQPFPLREAAFEKSPLKSPCISKVRLHFAGS